MIRVLIFRLKQRDRVADIEFTFWGLSEIGYWNVDRLPHFDDKVSEAVLRHHKLPQVAVFDLDVKGDPLRRRQGHNRFVCSHLHEYLVVTNLLSFFRQTAPILPLVSKHVEVGWFVEQIVSFPFPARRTNTVDEVATRRGCVVEPIFDHWVRSTQCIFRWGQRLLVAEVVHVEVALVTEQVLHEVVCP